MMQLILPDESGKWEVHIVDNGHSVCLSSCDEMEEAKRAAANKLLRMLENLQTLGGDKLAEIPRHKLDINSETKPWI